MVGGRMNSALLLFQPTGTLCRCTGFICLDFLLGNVSLPTPELTWCVDKAWALSQSRLVHCLSCALLVLYFSLFSHLLNGGHSYDISGYCEAWLKLKEHTFTSLTILPYGKFLGNVSCLEVASLSLLGGGAGQSGGTSFDFSLCMSSGLWLTSFLENILRSEGGWAQKRRQPCQAESGNNKPCPFRALPLVLGTGDLPE